LLEQQAKPEGGEQRGEEILVHHPADDDLIDDPAEGEHADGGDREADDGMDSQLGQRVGDIAAHDDEVALRQVLYVHHPPDEGQPIGRKREDRADQKPVQQ
jgi:hypothetical protein